MISTDYGFLDETRQSLLSILKEARVIKVEKYGDGVELTEICDEYFGVALNRAQFEQFIAELQELLK